MMKNKKPNQSVSSDANDNNMKIPGKKLDAFNYSPVAFTFSDEFKKVIEDKEGWADNKLQGIPINELSDDVCDPEVDALCRLESAKAYDQFAHHVRVVKDIIDVCRSELVRAKLKKAKLIEDNAADKAKLENLLELQRSLECVN